MRQNEQKVEFWGWHTAALGEMWAVKEASPQDQTIQSYEFPSLCFIHNTSRTIESLKCDLKWDEMDMFSHGFLMADIYSSLQSATH